MAVDQRIEFFTYELFNRLWLEKGFIKEPLIRKGNYEMAVESELNDDILRAVHVRVTLFAKPYHKIVNSKYWWFRYSSADFYAFVIKYFPSKDYCYKSVMDQILALCAFVTFMCAYSYERGNKLFISDSYLFCAMYIDHELKTQFYKEGGWFGLSRTCQSYIAIEDFLLESSHPVEQDCLSEFGNGITPLGIIRSIDKFQQFMKNSAFLEADTTAFWVYHCLEDMHDPFSQGRKDPSVEDIETLLTDLKSYCDPSASSVREFDKMYNLAMANKWNPKLFLNEYLKTRIKKCGQEPSMHDAAILYEEPSIPLPQTDPLSQESSVHQNQNLNFVVVDEEPPQSPPTLPTIENLISYVQQSEENWKLLIERVEQDYNPCPCHVAEISTSGSSLDGSYNVNRSSTDHKPCSFHVAEISTSGSSLDGSYNVNNPSKEETSPDEKNSPQIKNVRPKLSPVGVHNESLNTPKAFQDERDIVGKLSNLDINSFSCTKLSPNYIRSSGTMKRKRSSGKENSPKIKMSEETLSPTRTFNGSPRSPKVTESKKEQIICKHSNLYMNSLSPNDNVVSPNCVHSSVVEKKMSGREDITPNIQIPKQMLSPTSMLLSSQSTSLNSNVLKLGKCKVVDEMEANDNPTCYNRLSQDPSQKASITSEVEKKKAAPKARKSKSKSHTVVLSHNLPQHTKITSADPDEKFSHCLSPTDTDNLGKISLPNASNSVLGKERIQQKIAKVENYNKNSHSELSSQAQRETGVLNASNPHVKKKSKSHTVVLAHNLPQHDKNTLALKECTILDEKFLHYLSPTDTDDFSEIPLSSASNTVLGKESIHQKLAKVENYNKNSRTELPSQAQPENGVPSAPKPSAGKKKKKKSKKNKKPEETPETKSTHPKTRREHLEETVEYAKDILRMTLVMGNKETLKIIKPTIQYYKNNPTINEKGNDKTA